MYPGARGSGAPRPSVRPPRENATMEGSPAAPTARLELVGDGAARVVRLAGPLTLETVGDFWRDADELDDEGVPQRIDVAHVPGVDSAGAAFLLELRDRFGGAAIEGAGEQVRKMLAILDRPCPEPPEAPPQQVLFGMVDTLGTFAIETIRHARETVEYVGALSAGLGWVLRRPGRLRWGDTLSYMSRVGADALGIVALINGLMGLILAFQMASQMKQYGADIYVADVVGLSLARELAPLMTAVILAGRSGSAFAAEIGTMKVNEEVSALDAMGLDRTRFLVLPKVLALLAMMPLLVVFADAFGIIGGLVVGTGFLDLPVGVYLNQTFTRLDLWDVGQGLIRAECYAVVIAAVGCLRGLQTKDGAQGVGASATSAVVSSILLVVVSNALLAVIFYLLDV